MRSQHTGQLKVKRVESLEDVNLKTVDVKDLTEYVYREENDLLLAVN